MRGDWQRGDFPDMIGCNPRQALRSRFKFNVLVLERLMLLPYCSVSKKGQFPAVSSGCARDFRFGGELCLYGQGPCTGYGCAGVRVRCAEGAA